MSGPRPRRDLQQAVPGQELNDRAQALGKAVRAGGDCLDPAAVQIARELADKIAARTLAGSRTVAALAGATGSGKSTIFNALVGQEVSRISPRRPTTSQAAAAIWGDEPVAGLLDWLGVRTRHHVPAGPEGAGALDGLVLLDLPDLDSRVLEHRIEADRLLGLVDLFIWVTDPQKYADAVLHDDYVHALASHGAVTLVVLNQVDRLPDDAVQQCLDDLRRLLGQDGLTGVAVIPTSACTGEGMKVLTDAVGSVVQQRSAAEQRLLADVNASAVRLRSGVADHDPTLPSNGADELVDALARAAGVPVVVDAVQRDFARRASQHGGWPLTRWVHRLRPAPLTRLGLSRIAGSMSRSEANVVLGRSSLPPASPAAAAAVDIATRKLGARAAQGLPTRWARAVEQAATPADGTMHDALDQAVVGTSLRDRDPRWWTVASALQAIVFLVAIAGLVWLVVLAGLGWAQIHVTVPAWESVPIPILLLVAGLLAGFLLALLARAIAARGARRRARKVERRLREAIREVAQDRILDAIQQVLDAHRITREQLDIASRT